MRNHEEAVIDRLLLMRLIRAATRKGRLVVIPLHKLAFLSEYGMNHSGLRGFSYSFYRDVFGPAAPAIYEDFTALVDSGLIEDSPFRVTPKGNEALAGLEEAFCRGANKDILAIIEETVHSNPVDTARIKSKVYAMTIKMPNGQSQRIGEIPFNPNRKVLLLERLKEKKARGKFELTEEELETFDILLDADQCASLERANSDARNGRIRKVVH
jgi:hypothetical protein